MLKRIKTLTFRIIRIKYVLNIHLIELNVYHLLFIALLIGLLIENNIALNTVFNKWLTLLNVIN